MNYNFRIFIQNTKEVDEDDLIDRMRNINTINIVYY